MATIVLYTCDRCGATQTTAEQFWRIGVWAETTPFYGTVDKMSIGEKTMLEVCRPCSEQLGIHVRAKTPQPDPPPTLETALREIIETIAREAVA